MTSMVAETIVIKRFKPFKLGFCLCGCNEQFTLRNKMHYFRRYMHGHNKGHYNGGKYLDKDGYVMRLSKSHPNRDSKEYVREHILVYEEYLSILFDEEVFIPKGQEVHHINGKKDDNRLINLTCMSHVEHSRHHMILRYHPIIDERNIPKHT